MKRSHNYSSSDSDLDDNVEVEKDSGDENGPLDSQESMSPSSSSTQVQARKRRRGVIEKRRRDRINNSLAELRRLVPSAFDKQGSAKLEKAEILQMTVDHLKMLHAAGGKGFFEAQVLAQDYHSLGFRECVAETARFLSMVEGGDDPLRLRLVTHLSSYASQREAQTGLERLAWGSPFAQPLLRASRGSGRPPSSSPCSSPSSADAPRPGAAPPSDSLRAPPCGSLPLSLLGPASKPAPLSSLSSLSTFPLSLASFPLVTAGPASKPYRPWGTEIGAF